jgi:hypothetical protein
MAVSLPDPDMKHLHGPEEISLREDELVVVCLVRDGRPWLESFMEHYASLGARHIVFLDNGSKDDTVAVAAGYDNVTILRSTLPFNRYELLFRQYLIQRFSQGRWSLCVDIDELFDYPYSDIIGLRSLLGYLNGKSYTAVTAQMLDMFPKGPLAGQVSGPEESFRERHNRYDLSGLKRKDITRHSGRNNVFDSTDIECLAGGIRERVFDVMPRLTKFPLVFWDGEIRPVEGSPHHIDNARIADFSCVLLHYKYVGRFHEMAAQAVREENHWNDSAQYKQYLKVLDENPGLTLTQDTSNEIGGVDDLLEERFLVVSGDYVDWVNAEEERRVLLENEQHIWSEDVLKARRQDRAKTLRLHRLHKELRDLRQQLEESERSRRRLRRRVRRLKEQAAGRKTDPDTG